MIGHFAPLKHVIALLAGLLVTQMAAAHGLLAAASGPHVWFMIEPKTAADSIVLAHFSTESGWHYRQMATLPRQPVALAAWGDRAWLVFESRTPGAGSGGSAKSLRREVYSLQAVWNATLERYDADPHDHLKIAAPLPAIQTGDEATGPEELAGFIGHAKGPLALLVHRPLRSAAAATGAGGDRMKLLQLRNDRWVDLDLPPSLMNNFGGGRAFLTSSGHDNSTISIVVQPGGQMNRALRHDWTTDHGWIRSELAFPWGRWLGFTTVAGQIAAILEGQSGLEMELSILRSTATLSLATIMRPRDPWTAVGAQNAVYLVDQANTGEIHAQKIDALRGTSPGPMLLTVQPLAIGNLWRVALGIVAAIALLLYLLISRKPSSKQSKA